MRQEKVQLQKSKYSNTAAFGTLALEDGRVSFTLDPKIADELGAKFAAGGWRWIEKAQGSSGIKERLDAGEPVEVFNAPASEVEVKKLSIFSSLTGFELKAGGNSWIVVFKQVGLPGGAPPGAGGGAREASNRWQQAIAEAAASGVS